MSLDSLQLIGAYFRQIWTILTNVHKFCVLKCLPKKLGPAINLSLANLIENRFHITQVHPVRIHLFCTILIHVQALYRSIPFHSYQTKNNIE